MRQKRLLPTISIKYRKSLSYCASPFLSNKDVLSKKKYFRSKIQFLVDVGAEYLKLFFDQVNLFLALPVFKNSAQSIFLLITH